MSPPPQSPSQPLLGSSLVTQRSSERCVTSDDPNNGCKGDYLHPDQDFKLPGSLSIHEDDNDDNKNKKQFFE